MSKVVIILDSRGNFENVLSSDDCIEIKVLRRGTDDTEIDRAEAILEEVLVTE